MIRKLEEVQQEERGLDVRLDPIELITTEYVRNRFLDDISNNYERTKNMRFPPTVDEILFLDL
jgi:hypothetical protein